MKLLLVFTAFVLAASLQSCGCDSQSPDDVEEQFDADTIDGSTTYRLQPSVFPITLLQRITISVTYEPYAGEDSPIRLRMQKRIYF